MEFQCILYFVIYCVVNIKAGHYSNIDRNIVHPERESYFYNSISHERLLQSATNIALTKTAYQYPPYIGGGFPASNAVDGNLYSHISASTLTDPGTPDEGAFEE